MGLSIMLSCCQVHYVPINFSSGAPTAKIIGIELPLSTALRRLYKVYHDLSFKFLFCKGHLRKKSGFHTELLIAWSANFLDTCHREIEMSVLHSFTER